MLGPTFSSRRKEDTCEAVSGIVFDIQRSSLHDGPGIRTTVFLKGCPLNCAWCHNPESRRFAPQLSFDAAKCIGCRACVAACDRGVHAFGADEVHRVDFSRCQGHGSCVAACTAGALKIIGRKMTVAIVLAEVRKDRVYYEKSGGGMTLSGGEPTAQPRFSHALLRAARAEGIHTCVETCGATSQACLAAILPVTDLFLLDYKATGDSLHAKLTGSPATPILDNLRWLHAQGAKILLRCPLVPAINDTDAHLKMIAALTRKLPNLAGVEILAYHENGLAKFERIGEPQPALATHVPSETDHERWRQRLAGAGCDARGPWS